MMFKRLSYLVLIMTSVGFMIIGCAGMDVIDNVEKQEAVTIVLDTYRAYPSSNLKESRDHEQNFETRLRKSITRTNPKIKVISAEDFRRVVFNGRSFKDTPRTYEDLLSLTRDEEVLRKLEEARTRFIVVLDVSKTTAKGDIDFAASEGGFVLGRSHASWINIDAHIIDVKNPEKPERCILDEYGTSAYGVCVLLIFPIPYGWHPFFRDSTAFNDAGKQIAKFIEGRMGLEPVVPIVVKEPDLEEY